MIFVRFPYFKHTCLHSPLSIWAQTDVDRCQLGLSLFKPSGGTATASRRATALRMMPSFVVRARTDQPVGDNRGSRIGELVSLKRYYWLTQLKRHVLESFCWMMSITLWDKYQLLTLTTNADKKTFLSTHVENLLAVSHFKHEIQLTSAPW